jgi:hypothetical protein
VTSPARDKTTRTKEIPDQRQTETSLATWAVTYAVPVKAAGYRAATMTAAAVPASDAEPWLGAWGALSSSPERFAPGGLGEDVTG